MSLRAPKPRLVKRVKRGAVHVERPGESGPVQQKADKWYLMAKAMDEALDRMRTMWLAIQRLQELHGEHSCIFCGSSNWKPLLDETQAVAEVLRHGLKARPARGGNR